MGGGEKRRRRRGSGAEEEDEDKGGEECDRGVEEYSMEGVQYIIIQPTKITKRSRRSKVMDDPKSSFYKQLISDNRVRLLKKFKGITLYGEPASIELYAIERG